MGLFDFVTELLADRADDDPAYRCVNCGAEFDRGYHDCPECGTPYVAAVDPD